MLKGHHPDPGRQTNVLDKTIAAGTKLNCTWVEKHSCFKIPRFFVGIVPSAT